MRCSAWWTQIHHVTVLDSGRLPACTPPVRNGRGQSAPAPSRCYSGVQAAGWGCWWPPCSYTSTALGNPARCPASTTSTRLQHTILFQNRFDWEKCKEIGGHYFQFTFFITTTKGIRKVFRTVVSALRVLSKLNFYTSKKRGEKRTRGWWGNKCL